jgi:tetratricopeptide (TPR) repeat protein
MSHLDERTLGLQAINPALIRPAAAAHLAACDECRLAAEALREFEDALREPESWPAAVDPELRAFAVRSEKEDTAALALLEEFREPAAAARFVWADIANKTEYRTGGVARLLCKWANGMCERNPLYALKLAEAATAIANALPDTDYPRNTVHELRGQAMKEQANALLFLGRLQDALEAITDADAAYQYVQRESIGLASVTYVRGLVLYEQENLSVAEEAAHDAADIALRFEATDLYMSAKYLLGYVLFDRHDYAAAAEVFEGILRYGNARQSVSWIARASLAVGGCWLATGRRRNASRYLEDALRLFTKLDLATEMTRTHWMLARLMFADGNRQEAVNRLRRCIREFTEVGVLTDAALVALDVAEYLDAMGRLREMPKVLDNVVQTFVAAGKLTSALAALAYLKDAHVTPGLVAHVRRFVKRADRQPELLFAPPQEPV